MHRQTKPFLLAVAVVMTTALQARAQDPFEQNKDVLPLTTSTSAAMYFPKPLTYAQQVARYEAEQRTMRMERNRWIGFDPARPVTNSSYTYSGLYNFTPGNSYSVAYGSRHRFYGW
jgi:hypothetical protein